MKSFTLAASEANGAGNEALPFQLEGDDTQLYAYAPTQGQLVLLLDLADATPETMALAANRVMSVFWECLDDDTEAHLRERLLERTDPFDLPDIQNIIEWLVEESTARPTTPPSGSTGSPGSTGQRSTARARQRASTRSPSRRTASAT